jgi:hypothetical protein
MESKTSDVGWNRKQVGLKMNRRGWHSGPRRHWPLENAGKVLAAAKGSKMEIEKAEHGGTEQ